MALKSRQTDVQNVRGKLQRYMTWTFISISAVALLALFRFGWLQLGRGADMAEHLNYQARMVRNFQSPRGRIVDRNGRELAVSAESQTLFVDPSNVKDPDKLASELSPLINVSEEEIKADIAEGGAFVIIKHNLTHDEYLAVKQLIREKKYGDRLNFQKEAQRFYPNDMLAANILGFVGSEDKGLDGVEQAMDNLLKGEVIQTTALTDNDYRPIKDSVLDSGPPRQDSCKTVELTIDSTIQFIVETELDRAMVTTHPTAITCLVMDPRNGEVLAMASRPSFNPNRYWEYKPETWQNRGVSFIYEPGSTFKSIVASGALQEQIVTPNQVFHDPGYVTVSGRHILNWDGESYGDVTFTDIVKNSLNTGFAMVGLQMGAQRLTKYAKLFGFGEPTGIDLPGEESGLLFDPKEMGDSDIATMAIGQSIAVTPLQLITAMSAIANDGVLLQPHIIKSVRNPDGSIYMENKRTEVRRAIESVTSKTVTGLLEQVVATGGGGKAKVKGYRIAGKTGTAEKIRLDGAGYMAGHYIASFCGFAPVEHPELTVLVMIDDPTGIFYGGQIAAPVAGNIFSKLFRYLHIEASSDPFADENKKAADAAVPNVEPGTVISKEDEAAALEEGKVLVPDFHGKSIREAAGIASDAGLVFSSSGSGIADGQSVAPNTPVEKGSTIVVNFSP